MTPARMDFLKGLQIRYRQFTMATATGARLAQPQRPETVRSTKLVC